MFKPIEDKINHDDDKPWNQLEELHVVPVERFIYNIDIDNNKHSKYAIVTDNEIPIYKCDSNAKRVNLANVKDATCCKFRLDGDMVIIGTKTGQILMVSPKMPGKILQTINAHKHAITKIEYLYKFDPIQKLSASISDDGTLQVWDISINACLNKFKDSKEPLRALAVSKCIPNLIASGSLDGFIRVYDIDKSQSPTFIINTQSQINCLLFPFDSFADIILSAGDSTLQLWNLTNIEVDMKNKHIPTKKIIPHYMQITDICMSNDIYTGERVIFTCALDGMVKIISMVDFREIHKFEYPSSLMSIRISPNNQYLVVAGNDKSGNSKNCIYTRKLKDATANRDKKFVKLEEKVNNENKKHHDLINRFNLANETVTEVSYQKINNKPSKYEKLLRSNSYRALFHEMMHDRALEKQPKLFQYLIRAMVRHGALKRSLSGHKPETLNYLFKYLRLFIGQSSLTFTCIDVFDIIIELYPMKDLMQLISYQKVKKSIKLTIDNYRKLEQESLAIKELLLQCETFDYDYDDEDNDMEEDAMDMVDDVIIQ